MTRTGLGLALLLGLLSSQAAAQEIVVTVGEERAVSVDPGSRFSVPVIVDMSDAAGLDLASLELRLRWDAGRLSLVDAEAGSFGNVQTEQSSGGGELRASLSSATGATSTFTLLTLTLEASPEEGPAPVVVEPLAAADGAGQTILGSVRRRIFGACIGEPGLLGDVTGDASVNIIDAQQTARFVVGLGVVDLDRTKALGDVTDDGAITVVDAQQTARFAVGLPTGSRAGQEAAACLFTPVVSLVSPEEGEVFDAGVAIPFEATAVDVEDGEVPARALMWESDVDGALGSGNSLIRDDLSFGRHRVTLRVTDTDDNQAQSAVELRIVDLAGVQALLDDPFTEELVAGLTSSVRSAVEAALSACDAALSGDDVPALESCLAEARDETASATDANDLVLAAVLDLLFARAEGLLAI